MNISSAHIVFPVFSNVCLFVHQTSLKLADSVESDPRIPTAARSHVLRSATFLSFSFVRPSLLINRQLGSAAAYLMSTLLSGPLLYQLPFNHLVLILQNYATNNHPTFTPMSVRQHSRNSHHLGSRNWAPRTAWLQLYLVTFLFFSPQFNCLASTKKRRSAPTLKHRRIIDKHLACVQLTATVQPPKGSFYLLLNEPVFAKIWQCSVTTRLAPFPLQ